MSAVGGMDVYENAAAAEAARPVLSVLIPFYGSAPAALLTALGSCAAGLEAAIEIICADDGSPDKMIASGIEQQLARMPLACRLLKASANLGRSRIRNRLCEFARGDHVLFLDGDMEVHDAAFLRRYLDRLAAGPADVIFGGFEMPRNTVDERFDLHVFDSRRSHCLPAAKRGLAPAKYTYTSNLLVRRELMLAYPFAEEFVGWGWEDVDWALRIDGSARIEHIDNPAVHSGFSTAETLISKYRESVENFRRLCLRHPDKVRALPLYRASRLAGYVPCAALVQRCLQALVLDRRRWPLPVRYIGIKLLRAYLYRDVVRSLPAS